MNSKQFGMLLFGLIWPGQGLLSQEDVDVRQKLEEQSKRIEALEAESKRPPSWIESKFGSRLQLYGFLRLDAIFDDSRPQDPEIPGWILSEDGAAPPGIGAGGRNKNDFTFHPRLTRFGLNLDGPDVELFGAAELTGKLEIDFYNIGLPGQAPSRSAIRMRHAWLRLDWGQFAILAGQAYDLISPLYPVVNNDLVMWGAGNLGDRRPQIQTEFRIPQDDTTFVWQSSLGTTGGDDNQDLDPAGTFGNGFRDGVTSGLPTIQSRLGVTTPFLKQELQFGVWGHYAWEETDTRFAGENEFQSVAYGIDLILPLHEDDLWIKGEVWRGENVDDVRGGIFQGVNTVTGEEIFSRGGFVELGYQATEHVTLYAGASTDNPRSSRLNVGGRDANRIWYLASRFRYGAVQFGLEYLNWTTTYVGFSNGTDNRVAGFVSYSF